MTRNLGVLAVVVAVLGVGPLPSAQNSAQGIPMSGAVVDQQGNPIAGATVLLSRLSTSDRGSRGFSTVARAETDAEGAFSFGLVRLETAVEFPLETGVRFEYSVRHNNRQTAVAGVSYSAPRDRSGSLKSISASIRIQ
jgi:hypothetical protein